MVLFLLASLVAAQAPDAAAPVKPKHEKKVCRSATATGSRLPVTTCHTQAEWAAIDQSQQSIEPNPFPQSIGQH